MSVSHIILVWQFMASNNFTITTSTPPENISFCIQILCLDLKCMRCSYVIVYDSKHCQRKNHLYLVSGFDDYLSWLALLIMQ